MPPERKSPFEGHTPGPWKAGRGIEGEENRCYVTVDRGDDLDYLVAIIENGEPGDTLDSEVANAALIAAAPTLLRQRDELAEALRSVRGWLTDERMGTVSYMETHRFYEDAARCVSRIDAALAKLEKENAIPASGEAVKRIGPVWISAETPPDHSRYVLTWPPHEIGRWTGTSWFSQMGRRLHPTEWTELPKSPEPYKSGELLADPPRRRALMPAERKSPLHAARFDYTHNGMLLDPRGGWVRFEVAERAACQRDELAGLAWWALEYLSDAKNLTEYGWAEARLWKNDATAALAKLEKEATDAE